MRSPFRGRYPVVIVGIVFVFVRLFFPGFLSTSGYIISYILFLYFVRPLLFRRSIFELLERFLPESIRERVETRRQKRKPRGPIDFNRIIVALLLTATPAFVLAFPILDNLVEAFVLQKEASSDRSVVDSLLSRASVLLLFAIFWMLMFCNLLKLYFLDISIGARDDPSMLFPVLRHVSNSAYAVFLSFVLLLASYVSGFISTNVGFQVMLVVQLIVWVVVTSGGRFLHKPR